MLTWWFLAFLSILPFSTANVLSELKTEETEKVFPCPVDQAILPCVCTSSGSNLTVTCEGLTDVQQLTQAFSQSFPFSRLNTIIISRSSLGLLPSNVFKDKFTSHLILKDNPDLILSYLDTFESSRNSLLTLSISNSTLDSSSLEVFNHFDSLSEIYIRDAHSLSLGAGIQLPNLVVLDVSHNGLTTFPNLINAPELKRLIVSNNEISSLDGVSFSSYNYPLIEVIDLSFNTIGALPANSFDFSGRSIQLVDLTGNRISVISATAFGNLLSSTVIRLDNNYISKMESSVFEPILQEMNLGSGALYLTGNSLSCDCSIAWLVLNREFINHTVGGTCDNGDLPIQELDPQLYLDLCGPSLRKH